MDLVISLFKRDLSELRSHLQFIEQLKIDILPTSINYSYSNSSAKRTFDYCSIIISLYGLIENYLEKFCVEYSEIIENKILSYEDLDSKFRDNHFNLSIDLIKKISEQKHSKYVNISKKDVVNNLNNCLIAKQPYKLNKEAFTINTGNLKHTKICDILGNLNIKLDEKLKKKNPRYNQTENAFNIIDDLVQRRNEIAHGNVHDILAVTEINPYIDFVEHYMSLIGEIMTNEIEQLELIYIKKKSVLLSEAIVYGGSTIGIPNGKTLNLIIGDKIIIEKANKNMMFGEIIDLREFKNNDVTIKINKSIRSTFRFYK